LHLGHSVSSLNNWLRTAVGEIPSRPGGYVIMVEHVECFIRNLELDNNVFVVRLPDAICCQGPGGGIHPYARWRTLLKYASGATVVSLALLIFSLH